MRRFFPFLAALLALVVSCTSTTSLSAPALRWTAVDSGGALQVSWAAVAHATGYNIYYDSSATKGTSTTDTTIEISTPHATIAVTATRGSIESDQSMVDAAPVVTSLVTAYFTSSTVSHENGLGFVADGSCIAIDLSEQTNWLSVNFLLEDTSTYQQGPIPGLWSPDMYATPYNSQDDKIAPSAGPDFNALGIDPGPGVYNPRQAISSGLVYPLWISTDSTWNVNDHFAKAYVMGDSMIDPTDASVQFKVAYQKIGGLRWLVTQ
jgi:hypothetical protein